MGKPFWSKSSCLQASDSLQGGICIDCLVDMMMLCVALFVMLANASTCEPRDSSVAGQEQVLLQQKRDVAKIFPRWKPVDVDAAMDVNIAIIIENNSLLNGNTAAVNTVMSASGMNF